MSKRTDPTRGACGSLRRRTNFREVRHFFLVVCEGEETERNYFSSFRVPKHVLVVFGLGDNTLNLVKQALELRKRDDYDQVWCVFDRDDFPAQNFNAALELARNSGVRVAYSNNAFELWYLLHFNYHDTAISRQDYITKLDKLLAHPYAKISETMYAELEGRQGDAIRNAQRLLAQHDPPNPAFDNPSTTVHLLVEQLNRFIR